MKWSPAISDEKFKKWNGKGDLKEEWRRKKLKWSTSIEENEGKSESKSLLLQERKSLLLKERKKKEEVSQKVSYLRKEKGVSMNWIAHVAKEEW